jgi:hypothetical protein
MYKNQKDAIEEMGDDEILYKYTDYNFGSVSNYDEYVDLITSNDKKKHYYEILQTNQPTVLWCDIDGKFSDLNFNTSEECYLLFLEAIHEVFIKLNIKFDSSRQYILDASDDDKLSIHWMYEGMDFETNTDQKEFWNFVNFIIKSDEKYTSLTYSNTKSINTVLDVSVYTKNRAVRSIYSTKEGQTRVLTPVRLVKNKFKIVKQVDVEKYLITRAELKNPIIYDIKIPEIITKKLNYTDIEKIILKVIPSVKIDKIEGNLIKLKNDGIRICIINGEENKSDNSYCIVFNNRIDYYCHDSDCKKPKTIHKFNSFSVSIEDSQKTEKEMYIIFKNRLKDITKSYIESDNLDNFDDFYMLMDAITDYMNLSTVMIQQAKTYILRERYIKDDSNISKDLGTFEIMPSDDTNMALNYCNMNFKFPMFNLPKSMYAVWRDNINRKSALKCVFSPKLYYNPNTGNSQNTYNMFHGLAIEKNSLDDVKSFTEDELKTEGYFLHIKYRWCLGNIPLYNKVLDFFASILQRPWYKMKMCVILKSLERSGKGLPIQIFSELIGDRYFFQPTTAGEVLGNFNASMGNKLVVFMDEMVWGGDKEKAGVIKKFTTESTMTLKQKYMPDQIIQNCVNLIMASNEEWVIPAGTTDTRWLVLNVSDELSQMRDKKKWREIINGILNVDRKRLAKFFYERDISNFDDRETIKTVGLREQQVQSLSKINKWWLDCIDTGKFECENNLFDFENTHVKKTIYNSYKSHSNDKHITSHKFWGDMKKLCNFTINGKNKSKVIFDSLELCRDRWRIIFNDDGWTFTDILDDDISDETPTDEDISEDDMP